VPYDHWLWLFCNQPTVTAMSCRSERVDGLPRSMAAMLGLGMPGARDNSSPVTPNS
jgi:hypothetical protein